MRTRSTIARDQFWTLAIILPGFGLHVYRQGDQSLWFDETLTWWTSVAGRTRLDFPADSDSGECGGRGWPDRFFALDAGHGAAVALDRLAASSAGDGLSRYQALEG